MAERNDKVLLSTAYLAPIQYYAMLLAYDDISIEGHENYSRQSYRNRFKILGPNGSHSLSIPVTKKYGGKCKIKDILISYEEDWPRVHWGAILAAYTHSPFFEYYMDDFEPFYVKRWKYLLDLNNEMQQMLIGHLGIEPNISFTDDYFQFEEEAVDDYRSVIHPKNKNELEEIAFKPKPYVQVFSERHGFVPGLSIADLLFNMGPEAKGFLKEL